MKSLIVIALAAVTAIAAFGADVADAKRLGGGRSFGTQRQGITPPPAPAPSATTPAGAASNPVMPASPATAAARPATAGAAYPQHTNTKEPLRHRRAWAAYAMLAAKVEIT